MEILLNKDYGCYILSFAAKTEILKKKGIDFYIYKPTSGQSLYREKVALKYALAQRSPFSGLTLVSNDYGDTVSPESVEFLNDIGKTGEVFESRTDKAIIDVVKELGEEASCDFSKIVVVEIPDGSFYKISDYDGYETIYYSKSEIDVA